MNPDAEQELREALDRRRQLLELEAVLVERERSQRRLVNVERLAVSDGFRRAAHGEVAAIAQRAEARKHKRRGKKRRR